MTCCEAYVSFYLPSTAEDVLNELQGQRFLGSQLELEAFPYALTRQQEKHVHFSNENSVYDGDGNDQAKENYENLRQMMQEVLTDNNKQLIFPMVHDCLKQLIARCAQTPQEKNLNFSTISLRILREPQLLSRLVQSLGIPISMVNNPEVETASFSAEKFLSLIKEQMKYDTELQA